MTRVLASPALRLVLLGAVVTGAFVAFTIGGGPSADGIRDTIDSAGAAAPLAFVALYAGLTVIAFPGAIPSAASGLLFGTALGTVLTVTGATIGATLAFLIGRRLGRAQVERIAGERTERLDAWLERRGFVAVLYARLVPLVPFNVLNYAAGLTSIRTRDYVVATAIGTVPGSFAFTALGGSLDDPSSPEFIAAAALIVVLAAGGAIAARLRRATAGS